MRDIRVRKLFNIYGYDGGNFDGNVYDADHLSPSMIVGGGTPMIIEIEDER